MVDYVKTTNFLAKDSLVSGDPNKRIRGAEFNVEFDNLATAITSKVEKNNGVHTGTTSFESVTMSGTLGVTGLATLASVDINGGAIDDTVIGGTTPSTGAFTTLSSSGAATLDSLSTASATITGGSVNSTPIGNTTPSTGAFSNLSYTGTLTGGTGIVNIGSGQIYKDASGNVGVGTSSPQFRTDFNVTSTLTNNQQVALRLKSTTTADMVDGFGVTQLFSIQDSLGSNFNIAQIRAVRSGADDSGAIVFAPYNVGAANERVRITPTGQLAIGVTSPLGRVTIANPSGTDGLSVLRGSDYTSPAFRVSVDGVRPRLYGYGEGLTFWTGAVGAEAERARIDSAGNMGLGVTPSAWVGQRGLQVSGTGSSITGSLYSPGDVSNGFGLAHNAYYNAGWKYTSSIPFSAARYEQNIGAHAWFTAPSGTAGNTITFTQAMTLTNDGDLVIGATTPLIGSRVSVEEQTGVSYATSSASATGPSAHLMIRDGVSAANAFAGIRFLSGNANAGVYIGATNPSNSSEQGTLVIGRRTGANSYSESARITSSGYFKATNNGSYFHGTGTSIFEFVSNQANITVGAANTNTSASVQNVRSDLVTGAAGLHFIGVLNGVSQFTVAANGNVANTNNSYGAISDAKLKENVVDASSYLDRFMQVRFRNFNFIGSDLKQFGVIAQELEQVFPGLVDESPDMEQVTKTRTVEVPAVEEVLDEEGNVVTPAQPATTREEEYTASVPTGEVTKSVKYSVLALMAGKVIQEQQQIINDLLKRVETLEAK